MTEFKTGKYTRAKIPPPMLENIIQEIKVAQKWCTKYPEDRRIVVGKNKHWRLGN